MSVQAVRRLSWAIGIWTFSGLGIGFFDRLLWDTLWILTFAVWLGFALAGLLLFIRALSIARHAGWRRQEKLLVLAPPMLLALLFLIGSPLARAGDSALFGYRFSKQKVQYEDIISSVLANPTKRPHSAIWYEVDEGPPIRIAFPQPGGILDNWEAVIYDPTGVVASATGWMNGVAGNYSASPEVIGLFGGDLVGCRPIERSFYRCWFT
jgi:hypothetical protein